MAYNKEDQAAYGRQHYIDHKDEYKRRGRASREKFKREAKAYVEAEKSKPCTDCSQTFHYACMDFDHVYGNKVRNVSRIQNFGSMKQLLAEIEKCELVCANCHRLRSFKRMPT